MRDKYLIITGQDYDMFWVEDVIKPRNLNEYIQYYAFKLEHQSKQLNRKPLVVVKILQRPNHVSYFVDYGDGNGPVCDYGFSIETIGTTDNFQHDQIWWTSTGDEFRGNCTENEIKGVEWVREAGLKKVEKELLPKQLIDLTEQEFKDLKDSGMLWEFFPESPDFYKDIVRKKENEWTKMGFGGKITGLSREEAEKQIQELMSDYHKDIQWEDNRIICANCGKPNEECYC